jgi:hypothetical protein
LLSSTYVQRPLQPRKTTRQTSTRGELPTSSKRIHLFYFELPTDLSKSYTFWVPYIPFSFHSVISPPSHTIALLHSVLTHTRLNPFTLCSSDLLHPVHSWLRAKLLDQRAVSTHFTKHFPVPNKKACAWSFYFFNGNRNQA